MSYESKKVVFQNNENQNLVGRLELPYQKPQAYALFAHCFTCTKDIAAASRISRALCDQGIAVLRFDFTGLGGSDGDFSQTHFSSNVEDLVSAAHFLKKEYQAPAILIGHSLGGAAVLAASSKLPETKAICTIAAPSDPEHVKQLLVEDLEKIKKEGEATVSLAGRPFKIKKSFLDDIASQNLKHLVQQLKAALLIFHSPIDNIISINHAQNLYQWAKHPKSFVSLDNADHLLTRLKDSEYVATVLAAWASRYINLPEQTTKETPEGMVRVEEVDHRFKQKISLGKHLLIADEPPSVGGTNKGPAPYDLLLAGLGACTSMTLRMYATHKKIPLKHIVVNLRHEKIQAKDGKTRENREGRMDHIDRCVELIGELTHEQKNRLLEIANKCPVHKTLHSEIDIQTRIQGSD